MNRRIKVPNDLLLEEVAHLISTGKDATIRVKGNSMRPFLIGEKDKVRLTPTKGLSKYDIVLARIDQQYILHRIIKINNKQFILMGDGNLHQSECCTYSDIIAQVKTRIRGDKESIPPLLLAKIWVLMLPFRRILLHLFSIIQKI